MHHQSTLPPESDPVAKIPTDQRRKAGDSRRATNTNGKQEKKKRYRRADWIVRLETNLGI